MYGNVLIKKSRYESLGGLSFFTNWYNENKEALDKIGYTNHFTSRKWETCIIVQIESK